MQVRHDEGVVIDIGPEPCVVVREGGGEASGRGAHRPAIEPRKEISPGRRRRSHGGRRHGRARDASARTGPAWSKTLACAGRRSSCGDREVSSVAVAGSDCPQGRRGAKADDGRRREMRVRHRAARKPTNKAGRPAAEPVERRAETEGMRA